MIFATKRPEFNEPKHQQHDRQNQCEWRYKCWVCLRSSGAKLIFRIRFRFPFDSMRRSFHTSQQQRWMLRDLQHKFYTFHSILKRVPISSVYLFYSLRLKWSSLIVIMQKKIKEYIKWPNAQPQPDAIVGFLFFFFSECSKMWADTNDTRE